MIRPHVLDTNVVTELLRATPKFVARFDALPETAPIFTTTVTIFEILMKGRYQALLAAAANPVQLLRAAAWLAQDEVLLRGFDLLPFTPAAGEHFGGLLENKKLRKIGRADLLIACIALAHNATLVTRNTKDFAPVPGLKLENWAD